MLSLLLIKNKVLYLFSILFLLILCSVLVSGFKLSVSPSEVYLDSDVGEEICRNYSIFYSDQNAKIEVNNYWRDNLERKFNISDYILESNDLGLNSAYNSYVNLKNNNSFEYCVSGSNSGVYEGVLFFESSDYGLSIASFIHLNVIGNLTLSEKDDLYSSNTLTGLSIFNEFNSYSKSILWSLILMVVSLISLLFLLLKFDKKRRESVE